MVDENRTSADSLTAFARVYGAGDWVRLPQLSSRHSGNQTDEGKGLVPQPRRYAPRSSPAARCRHARTMAEELGLMNTSSGVRLRRVMVASLEASGAIRSKTVRDTLLAVAREQVVPQLAARDGLAAIYRPEVAPTTATDNRGVAVSSSSAPAIMAPMLEALALEPGQRVLEEGG
jgi:protein-L-isoaspartate(D-aspartate) O-methyltransferase